MEIKLAAKNIKVTQPLRDYVQQKVGRAQKYFDHIVWGQVFLFVEKRAQKAEMIVHAPGHTFRALATAADLYSAIDLASDKIDTQLKKHKERIKSRHKPKASDTMAEAMPPVETDFSVVRQPVVPMTPEQAAAELDGGEHRFRVFLDKDSDQIQVVFKREDESIGIIQPVRRARR
ncbi:MAG: ribosome-associated translation inhibitor RaiA [Elusimicrobiota bacterium]|nr:ribosome-associated translation inhibitor RaiA [Elusimicrobiota bacterium]